MYKTSTVLVTILLMVMASFIDTEAQNLNNKFTHSEDLLSANIEKEKGDTENKWDYFIYPVPAIDELNIKITKGNVMIDKVIVANEDGEEVLVLENQQRDKIKLNIEELKPGKYIVQIISNSYQTSKIKRFYIIN